MQHIRFTFAVLRSDTLSGSDSGTEEGGKIFPNVRPIGESIRFDGLVWILSKNQAKCVVIMRTRRDHTFMTKPSINVVYFHRNFTN